MRPRHRLFILLLLAALAHVPPLWADAIGLATLGDSLTDTYAGKPYAGGNQNWTDLLGAHRSASVGIHNLAQAGSTSAALLLQGQHTSAANLVQQGTVQYVTLAVGANDIGAFLLQINPNNPATFDPTPTVTSLVGNVAMALGSLRASGARVMLANVPDIAQTPQIQTLLAGTPALLGLVTAATQAVNAQLEILAQANGVPVIDLYGLNNLSSSPLLIGGVDVQPLLYGPDCFHPSTIGSALLANVELEALRQAYQVDIPNLTDAEILAAAGLTAMNGTTTFNAADFVHQAPEPSSLVMLVSAGAIFTARRWRRQRVVQLASC